MAESVSWLSIATIFKYDCKRSAFSGELGVSGIFSHSELILLYFLHDAWVMADVVSFKRVAINFLRIVSWRTAYCSRSCVSEGRSVDASIFVISPCCVVIVKSCRSFFFILVNY
jgi:hypothetical protein